MTALETIRQNWMKGAPGAAAELAAMLPEEVQPLFAGRALAACAARLRAPHEVTEVVRVSADPKHWKDGHIAFDAVRDLVLRYERQHRGSAYGSDPSYLLLFVAEGAARIIYNATAPSDPFDDDAGEVFFRALAAFIHGSTLKDLELQIWEIFQQCRGDSVTESSPSN